MQRIENRERHTKNLKIMVEVANFAIYSYTDEHKAIEYEYVHICIYLHYIPMLNERWLWYMQHHKHYTNNIYKGMGVCFCNYIIN